MQDLLKNYPVVIEIPIAWGDMDAFQHVNNIVYFRYFESARIAYFEKLNLNDQMIQTGIGTHSRQHTVQVQNPANLSR
jgi:acyl-CoA thioester hydrolase